MTERKWAGTTYGNEWMHKRLICTLKVIDIRLLYAFAFIFIVPICLIRNVSYSIIYHYFRRHFGFSPLQAFYKTYINHCLFAQTVIDKFAMYAGRKFKISIEGYDHFLSLSKKNEGFMLLSAHIGNYEIAGYTLITESKPINALVFQGEKNSIMANRKKMFAGSNIRMIPVDKDMEHLFEIEHALTNGEIVSLAADRIFGSSKTITADFLNAEAHFPQGPFSVATIRNFEVLAVNVMKTSLTGYTIYISPLHYDKKAPYKKRIYQLATAYVTELEHIIRLYPTQWYNYFDFWT